MLKNFLLYNFFANSLYLGYKQEFTNSKMFIDLAGSRSSLDIHNLTSTLVKTKKILLLLLASWKNNGITWIIAPKNGLINSMFLIFKMLVTSTIYLWYSKWKLGFLTKRTSFPRALRYPSNLFYVNYSKNVMKLRELRKHIIQFSIIDSTSNRDYVNFSINANEKTSASYLYFCTIFFTAARRAASLKKKELLF